MHIISECTCEGCQAERLKIAMQALSTDELIIIGMGVKEHGLENRPAYHALVSELKSRRLLDRTI